ncbi:protein ALP1-like isoform X1 [Lolium perenne]|uniref:protein ALP1-like isoform X1 n=1 Tax=Lolium perenne TaxID=4522 RepID=UPI0021F58296|nr:protein ALP1-like isoform X1 [Lolium perenne]XP_051179370.1 protein ALP1-like isoform X1 [Lolium perenne]
MSDQLPDTSADEADAMEEIIDASTLYTLDDLLAEQDIIHSFAKEIATEVTEILESHDARSLARSAPSAYVNRPREEAADRLVRDYFCENPIYPEKVFRRRFWMRRALFERIVHALGEWSPEFTQRRDALDREGLSPLQKCTSAIRQLAYGTPADALDEYLKIAECTSVKCLKLFTEGVIHIFGDYYMRRPNVDDVQRLLDIGESRGFPGMLGSLDCMHWRWEKCPMSWRGQFTSGYKGAPTLILEAVASQDLWIWHAFFGLAGSNNDINVLNQSKLFVEELKGQAPIVSYRVNDRDYEHGYYLVAAFVKSIPMAQTEKHKLFAAFQEGARKDVERAFGVLQARWSILRGPARLYDRGDIHNIMIACIILHNMIVEDEKEEASNVLDLNHEAGSSTAFPSVFTHGDMPVFAEVLERDARIRDRPTHKALKNDLIEHIWKKFRPR